MESKFLVSVNYPFNVINIAAVSTITGDVNLYLHGCVSLLAPECSVFLCVGGCMELRENMFNLIYSFYCI